MNDNGMNMGLHCSDFDQTVEFKQVKDTGVSGKKTQRVRRAIEMRSKRPK